MMLAHRRFADDPIVLPAQMAEMHSQRDASQTGGGGRSATPADGDLVFDVDAQGRDLAVFRLEHLAIGSNDEVVLMRPQICASRPSAVTKKSGARSARRRK